MKTQEQIIERIKYFDAEENKIKDFFGFQRSDLVTFLAFEDAKQFLTDPDKIVSKWKQEECTDENVLLIMKDYMSFAWNKCNNQRGLSAGRSIQHYQAWLWLIGEDELSNEIAEYSDYGRPQLTKICQKYGWPVEE